MATIVSQVPSAEPARGGMRRPAVVAIVVLVVVALGVLVVGQVEQARRSDLQRALDLAPSDAVRYSWTDWAAVREELGLDISADPTRAEVTQLLARAFDADLSSTSALVGSAVSAQAELGYSPASIDWELFSQGSQGALVTMKLASGADVAAIGDDLERAGFTRPAEPDGVWQGGPDVLARVGPTMTPELGYVTLDEEAGLLRTSDVAEYVAAASTDGPSGTGQEHSQGLEDVVGAIGSPLAAAVYDGPYTCESLAMVGADRGEQTQASTLIAQAGAVSPLTGFAIGLEPGGGGRVEMSFERDDQARQNADSRAALARGPAPGQGGSFPDRFALDEASASGRVVTLALRPTEGTFLLSDLGTGPVLFATC